MRRLLCAVLLLVSLCPIAAADGTEPKTVRVGFYPCPFNIKDESGHLSGYAYDYQQDIAAYTGWQYEYVEATWPELMQMLKDGEIDLLSDVSHTPERESEMLFSAYPMGTEGYYLYVSRADESIDRLDEASLHGKRIGINAGSVQAGLFEAWARENGVQAQVIPGNGDEAMVGMLERGEIDAVVAVDSYGFDNTIPVARIGGSDFYFAINKARPDLKAELDRAMDIMLNTDRYYNERLHQQYLNNNISKSLSPDDLQWLHEHGTIRVGYLDDYLAYCDRDDDTGELVGALHEFLNAAETCLYNAVLEFEPVAFSNGNDMRAALQAGEVDCVFPTYSDRYHAEQSNRFVTKSGVDISMIALVKGGGFNESAANVVAIRAGSVTRLYAATNYPAWKILEAASEQACLDLVRRGAADCAVFNANRVDYVIQRNHADDLKRVTLSQGISLSFSVRRDHASLLHILNQALDAVPNSVMNGALTYYAIAPRRITLADFVKENMAAVFGSIGVIVLLLCLLLRRMHVNGRRLAAALEEARREKEHAELLNLRNQRLEVEANHDALTRIGNRGFFFSQLDRMMETSGRFVVCYCDLDNLKAINDRYGHAEGDGYIRRFVEIVRAHLQDGDIFARIGGDEFCMILRGCGYDTALGSVQKMQEMFSGDAIRQYPQSFSCGLMEVPEDHADMKVLDILKQADARMYEQKQAHKQMLRQAVR